MLKVKRCPVYMYEVYNIKLNFNIVDLTRNKNILICYQGISLKIWLLQQILANSKVLRICSNVTFPFSQFYCIFSLLNKHIGYPRMTY